MELAMPNPVPSGLPFEEIRRLGRFAKTRRRLYALHLAWILLTAVVVFLATLDAIEPVPWLRWLPDLMAIVAPGLPVYLAGFVARCP